MKYLIFLVVCVGGVPAMAYAAMLSSKVRGLVLSALIFSTALGVRASINFMSMEDYRGPDRGFEVTLTDLITMGLVAGMMLRFPGKISLIPYNTLFMAFFWGMACISVLVAPAQDVALFTLFKLVRLYMVYWCVVNCMRTDVHRNFVWAGFIAVGLYVSVLSFEQKYLGGVYRAPGPFDHSNTVPIYLNMIIPVILLWGLCDRSFKPWQSLVSIITALGMLFSVVSTQSRAGQAIAAASLLAVFAFVNGRERSFKISLATVLVLVVVALGPCARPIRH